MSVALAYLDTSAIVKLVRPEAETKALFIELARWPARVSSALARVELRRALRRADASAQDLRRAEATLDRLTLVDIDDEVLRRASALPDKELRALDAIHLATALSLGRELGAMLVYDVHLQEAARAGGLHVVAPGPRR